MYSIVLLCSWNLVVVTYAAHTHQSYVLAFLLTSLYSTLNIIMCCVCMYNETSVIKTPLAQDFVFFMEVILTSEVEYIAEQ